MVSNIKRSQDSWWGHKALHTKQNKPLTKQGTSCNYKELVCCGKNVIRSFLSDVTRGIFSEIRMLVIIKTAILRMSNENSTARTNRKTVDFKADSSFSLPSKTKSASFRLLRHPTRVFISTLSEEQKSNVQAFQLCRYSFIS